ncbi:MAG: DUF5671 domain-containing protein [Patescibacteria group bacterium]|nr:DUF5671 domain-containing protein [Patescibacteria group bacterium]MDD5716095.1 DUF5671 domain-containing protein [Patescibacteria group bacterium]
MALGILSNLFPLVLLIFIIAIIMENKAPEKKGSILRNVYFYMASLVTLGIAVGSLIFLANVGLKTWVFTDAEPLSYRLGQPPVLYFDQSVTDSAAKPVVSVGAGAITCDSECTLSTDQQNAITDWKASYETWTKNKDNPNASRQRDLINGFSFLIVALPIFIIHYRIVQREAKRKSPEQHNPVRTAYYYFVSLAALVMTVVSVGMFLNLALKNWVFPSVGDAQRNSSQVTMGVDEYSISGVQSVVTCGATCGLDTQTVSLAQQWIVDFNSWNSSIDEANNNTDRQAAGIIPFILFGVPLFWYHWSVVRKESKERKNEQQAVGTGPANV